MTDLITEIVKAFRDRFFPQVEETFGVQLEEFLVDKLKQVRRETIDEVRKEVFKLSTEELKAPEGNYEVWETSQVLGVLDSLTQEEEGK